MTYEPIGFKDRVVERPRTYFLQENPDGSFTLIPAPGEVYEEGTPLNAANLNKLEQGLVDSIYRIGDIKTTVRTDLGDDWLLCNGDAVSEESYPDLYALLGLLHGAWTANNQGSANLYGITYGNGYWVAVGSNGTLYYKADTPVGTWTANKQGSVALYGITYGNGYWVAVGGDGTLYYKADTPVGTWTANNQGSVNLQSVTYGNGYWVTVGSSGTLYYKVKTLPTITLDGAYAYIRAK